MSTDAPSAARVAKKWKKLPPGWTDKSVEKFWGTLTGTTPKHKVWDCVKKMTKPFGDGAGAFCGGLADWQMPGWREKNKKESPEARSDAKSYWKGKIKKEKKKACPSRVAMRAKEASACGKCFSWATENAKGSDLVVHGNIKGLLGPHAWIERGNRIFDWQTDVLQWYFSEGLGKEEYRDTGWPKDEFYKTFKPHNLKKYRAQDAKKNDRIVKLGPWHGVPPKFMVEGLIDPVAGDNNWIRFRS